MRTILFIITLYLVTISMNTYAGPVEVVMNTSVETAYKTISKRIYLTNKVSESCFSTAEWKEMLEYGKSSPNGRSLSIIVELDDNGNAKEFCEFTLKKMDSICKYFTADRFAELECKIKPFVKYKIIHKEPCIGNIVMFFSINYVDYPSFDNI